MKRALRLTCGSGRLIAARWMLVVLSSLPAGLASHAMLASGPARSPYFTMEAPPLPWTHFGRLFGEIPAAVPVALAAAWLAVLGGQILLAGAVAILRSPDPESRPRVRAAMRAGGVYLRGFLMLAVAALVAAGAGAALVRAMARALGTHGERAGWGGVAMVLVIPSIAASLVLLWTAAVATWLLWARALLVIHGRGVVRAARAAAAVIARHPAAALAFPMALSLASIGAGGALAGLWLAAEPASAWGIASWSVAMLAMVAAQSFAWHWMVRAVCLMAAALQPAGGEESMRGAVLTQDGPPRDAISS